MRNDGHYYYDYDEDEDIGYGYDNANYCNHHLLKMDMSIYVYDAHDANYYYSVLRHIG